MTTLALPSLTPRFRLASLRTCYLLLAPAMIFILAGLDRSYQTDLWHHLARGRAMWESGSIISRDLFTFTMSGQAIVDNNWLTQLVAYGLFSLGGIELVQAVNALLLATAVGLTVQSGVRLGASMRVAGIVGVVVVAGLANVILIRPQTMSIVLFAALLRLLIAARRQPGLWWFVPLVMALWANVHGAFPIGLALIACFAVPKLVRDEWNLSLLALPLCAIATLLNPYGYRVYSYVSTTSSRATDRVIQEWLAPSPATLSGALLFATMLAGMLILLTHARRSRAWMWLALLGFAVLACTSVRMSIWWYLAAGPIVMALLARRKESPATPSVPATAVAGMMSLAAILALPALAGMNPVFALRSPARPEDSLQQMAAAIEEHAPAARLFARLEWSEYFTFALPWPNAVFVDGRIEIVNDALWDDYRRISSADADWQKRLDRYGVDTLLLDAGYHDGLIERVSASGEWREEARVGKGILFTRTLRMSGPDPELFR